jgi:hypothetical protein
MIRASGTCAITVRGLIFTVVNAKKQKREIYLEQKNYLNK